jgi:molecular chaperone GrpE (heat shock protein)
MSDPQALLEQVTAAQAELAEATRAGFTAQRRALAELRRELLGDRRETATTSVFLAVAPALDSLEQVRAGLDGEASTALAAQTDAVASALRNLLQSLGYTRFEAAVGERFEPQRMECVGHLDGTPGVVLAAVRPGYAAGAVVVRPAGVLVAAPEQDPDEGRQQ